MCGIVGKATALGGLDHHALIRMRDTLQHRGPDDAGIWVNEGRTAGLGHRRLAVIDLSEAGHQPMASQCGRFQITFNGEIYNYRELREELTAKGYQFRTITDTEVIVAAFSEWGESCVEFLNGMFAFAVYDDDRQTIFIARDRVGEKPLFYSHQNHTLTFASELKALLADPDQPRRMDLESLDQYLAFGYVSGSSCLLAGVQKLAPAHALTYDIHHDSLRRWRYWSLPSPCDEPEGNIEAITDELEHLLGDAVKRQLVADVPIGVLLSGGLDSSLVTALAARHSSGPLRTFTIVFPEHSNYNEGPFARIVAEHFGTEHTELEAEGASVELLGTLARQYDEPIADSSMVPTYLVSRLIRQHCTVALGGDGGDELFGGYMLYSVIQAQQFIRGWIPGPVRSAVAALSARLPVGVRGRTYGMSLAASSEEAVARSGIYLDPASRVRLAPVLESLHHRAERYRLEAALHGRTLVQQLTMADFHSYLPDDILVKVDRASMLTSLELRAPFLDRRVIEFAYGRIPDKYRATLSKRKVLLRHLGRRLLPPKLNLTRKQGFSIPLSAWFKGEWGKRMGDVLADASPGLFDHREIDNLVALQRKGFSNSARLYALTMLELWRREYNVGLPA
jgi:asparagine synthase (glutamine-hydrolysing)